MLHFIDEAQSSTRALAADSDDGDVRNIGPTYALVPLSMGALTLASGHCVPFD